MAPCSSTSVLRTAGGAEVLRAESTRDSPQQRSLKQKSLHLYLHGKSHTRFCLGAEQMSNDNPSNSVCQIAQLRGLTRQERARHP